MESINPTKSTYWKLWGFSTIFGFSDIGDVSFMLEKTGVPWKKYHFQFQWYRGCKWQSVVGHWQTLSHEVVSNTPSQGWESSTQPLPRLVVLSCIHDLHVTCFKPLECQICTIVRNIWKSRNIRINITIYFIILLHNSGKHFMVNPGCLYIIKDYLFYHL